MKTVLRSRVETLVIALRHVKLDVCYLQ